MDGKLLQQELPLAAGARKRRIPAGDYKLLVTSSQRRNYFIEQWGGCCCHCSRRVAIVPKPGLGEVQINIDHIVPKSRGGSNAYENLCASCTECNMRKSSLRLSSSRTAELVKRAMTVAKAMRLVVVSASRPMTILGEAP